LSDFPITHLYELGRLSQAGDEVTIATTAEERQRLAEWADVDAVDAFTAKIELRKLSPTRYAFDAELAADIVQSCVVTLEPVRTRIERKFSRDLLLTPTPRHVPKEIDIAPVDEDGREEIESLRYDLAVPVLEELALAIDPYPRAPGVAFEPPPDPDAAESHPFAALKSLKAEQKP
jgi:uncharacterized metal-binding protein YceD (DUF177 family)